MYAVVAALFASVYIMNGFTKGTWSHRSDGTKCLFYGYRDYEGDAESASRIHNG